MENQLSNKTNEQCESTFASSSSHSQSLLRLLRMFLATSLSQLHRVTALVSQETLAILRAGIQASSNYRIYGGLLLIAVAHVSEVAYVWFDSGEGEPTDYWNTYYYLYAIGPHLSTLLTVTGFYLLFPQFSRIKIFSIIPATYKLAKILWLSCITSNPELHRFVPFSFIVLGFGAAFAWLLTFEWLMNLHYHKREGTIARILGIISAPNIDAEQKVSIANQQIEILKQLK
jgi:hypothetical protein